MKTIEEKAKAYDEIIERAKTMLAAGEVMYGKENNASQLITDLIPELEESDDERIRKALIRFFNEKRNCVGYTWGGFKCDDVIAYLEKQKEQKPIEFKNDELVEIIKGEFEGFRQLLKKKGIDYEPQRSYWEAFARLFDSSAREYVKEQKSAEKQDYSGLTDFERAIHRGFLCAGVENVPRTIIKETAQDCLAHLPAEWSDKDKNIFNLALDLIKHSDDCSGILDQELAVKWFAELPSRFVPQPKQEWSEEDDVMFNTAKKIIWESEASDGTTNKVISWLGGKLRSLHHQPKQEWSVEDEKRYLSCLCRLGTGNPDQPETQNSKWFREHVSPQPHWKPSVNTCPHYSDGYGCDISPMKECESCEHRPSWKPSEEQMKTIGLAIQVLNSSGHNSLCCKLNALRDDLLKQK